MKTTGRYEPYWCTGADDSHEPVQADSKVPNPHCPVCGYMMTFGNYYAEPSIIIRMQVKQ